MLLMLMMFDVCQIAYGTTENSPVTFQGLMDDTLDRRVSTVGTVHPHVEVRGLTVSLFPFPFSYFYSDFNHD